jgi:hypothetical protein
VNITVIKSLFMPARQNRHRVEVEKGRAELPTAVERPARVARRPVGEGVG